MNALINVNNDTQTVSARELHEKLNIGTEFAKWFSRMCEYGFCAVNDYSEVIVKNDENSKGGRPATDYNISVDMAKQICMIQRTPEGKQVRQYLIDIEKAWNTPELVMARGLKAAQQMIEQKDAVIAEQKQIIEEQKPKALFADAVSASDTSILVRDLAKMIRQNGVEIGEKRLYKWLRENGYICKGSTMPTQRAMEMELFEIVVRTVEKGNGLPLETKTAKVTGKGQIYFVEKLLGKSAAC